MDRFNFIDGRIHFRNIGVKGFKPNTCQTKTGLLKILCFFFVVVVFVVVFSPISEIVR